MAKLLIDAQYYGNIMRCARQHLKISAGDAAAWHVDVFVVIASPRRSNPVNNEHFRFPGLLRCVRLRCAMSRPARNDKEDKNPPDGGFVFCPGGYRPQTTWDVSIQQWMTGHCGHQATILLPH